ncbi:MAG TPA: thioredoxin family protein [Prolixibacteraceae bacterium]|nr:thioredoxin family protein [Prolixibacteraceae bacterium]
MFQQFIGKSDYDRFVEEHPAVLAYFSTVECGVCKVLKPKVEEMIFREFPEIKLVYVEINQSPEIAAQNRIFTVPVVLVYFEGREFFRKSRNFGVDELRNELIRPYSLLFS